MFETKYVARKTMAMTKPITKVLIDDTSLLKTGHVQAAQMPIVEPLEIGRF